MKFRIIPMIMFFSLISGVLFDANAITTASIEKTLYTLGSDVQKSLPREIKNVAVYGVLKDQKRRYDDSAIAEVVVKKLREAKLTIADRSDDQQANLDELALNASGVVDINSIKKAGKMAGVDAFFFVYPAVSGFMSKRLSIMIKAVDVATGAVLFVQEYNFNERPIVDLDAGFQTSLYRGFGASMDVYAFGNPPGYDWNPPFHMIGNIGDSIVVLKGIFNIPQTLISVVLGVGLHPGTLGGARSGFPNLYIASNNQTNMEINGFQRTGFVPIVEIIFPISALLGDRNDTLRLNLGCEFDTFGNKVGQQQDGNRLNGISLKNMNGTNPINFTQPSQIFFPIAHAGLDLQFLPYLALNLAVTYMPSWSATTETIDGVHIVYTGTGGIGLTIGLTYKIL